MTPHRFLKIAQLTASIFWPSVRQHLKPPELLYLERTPTARRNLERAIVRALAKSLLDDDDISKLPGIEDEEPQQTLPDSETEKDQLATLMKSNEYEARRRQQNTQTPITAPVRIDPQPKNQHKRTP